jgi:phenylpropionate dioxygenase-like ring-hydroxylating dioxygenase large terminal subunit
MICDEGKGKLDKNKRFKCPYHGWEYNTTDGRLAKALHVQGKQ